MPYFVIGTIYACWWQQTVDHWDISWRYDDRIHVLYKYGSSISMICWCRVYIYQISCRLPSYIYNIVYNDRDPIDVVTFTKYIHNKKKKKNESSL